MRFRATLALALASAAHIAYVSPSVILEAPSIGAGTFLSSHYVWYGRGDINMTVRASGVFLSGTEFCNPARDDVEGIIVITDQSGTACDLEEGYARVTALGAVGVIHLVVFSTPGLLTFRHQTWKSSVYAHQSAPLLEVAASLIGRDKLRPGDLVLR